MLPATTSGSESTSTLFTAVDTFAFSVCTCAAAAVTSTVSDTAPTCSGTSMRSELAAISVRFCCENRRNPCAVTSIA